MQVIWLTGRMCISVLWRTLKRRASGVDRSVVETALGAWLKNMLLSDLCYRDRSGPLDKLRKRKPQY